MARNWKSRASGATGRETPHQRQRRLTGARDARDVVPMELQTGLPDDITAQLKEPGFSIGHVTTEDPRIRHPLDGRTNAGAKLRAGMAGMLDLILTKVGQRGQIFTNFRAAVGVADQLVLPYNPARNYLIVVNTGAQTIFAAFERAANAATAVPIVAGGNYEPILGTVSSLHLVSTVALQSAVIVEGFYTWAGGRPIQNEE